MNLKKEIDFLIIGENCLDIFVYGSVKRKSPEAPAPVFVERFRNMNYGMARNVFSNLANMITDERIEIIYSDEFATKTRYINEFSNEYYLRIDKGDQDYLQINLHNHKHRNFELIKNSKNIIISDYDKGFILNEDIIKIREINPEAIIFIDTKKILTRSILEAVNFVKINDKEFKNNLIYKPFKHLFKKHQSKIIVTKGSEGAEYLCKKYKSERVVQNGDVCGAGDTFLSAFAYKYNKSLSVSLSIQFANECSSQVVEKKGVAIYEKKDYSNGESGIYW